jgi:hypothetical protein
MSDDVGEEGRPAVGRQQAVPLPGRCHFFLGLRRNRYCRSQVIPGQLYCGNHLDWHGARPAAGTQRRVPCPLDPTHTVRAADLEVHVEKKCPALRIAQATRVRTAPRVHARVGSLAAATAAVGLPLANSTALTAASSALPGRIPYRAGAAVLPRGGQRWQRRRATSAHPRRAGQLERRRPTER